jgi:hypothetical protein
VVERSEKDEICSLESLLGLMRKGIGGGRDVFAGTRQRYAVVEPHGGHA